MLPCPPLPGPFSVTSLLTGRTLEAAVRALWPGVSWTQARRWIGTGKVQRNGTVESNPTFRVSDGDKLSLCLHAPKPATSRWLEPTTLVHVDAQIVVVRKPSGMNTVPFEDKEQDTLEQLVRALLNRRERTRGGPHQGSLGVVHRLDRDTTGLLVFARTLAAKKHLSAQFRQHTVRRRYEALAQGTVRSQTICSQLVADRGDGRRGSTRLARIGQRAVTHVELLANFQAVSHIACRLETGRTHQIRIHLAEAGHPLVGERVYGPPGKSTSSKAGLVPRIMLHAAELGFVHPHTGLPVGWVDPLPDDFQVLRDRWAAEAKG